MPAPKGFRGVEIERAEGGKDTPPPINCLP